MDRITARAATSALAAAVVGILLVYATEIGLVFCVLAPTLCFLQHRRIHAFIVSFAYYGAASSVLIPGAKSFFGAGTGWELPIALWGAASLLLALPYGALWSKNRHAAQWLAPLAVLVSVPPPLGIIGWANPLTAAGALFPGTGWFGLLAVLCFAGGTVRHFRTASCILMTIAVLANAIFAGIPTPPTEWEAVDTTFGDVRPAPSNILRQYQTAQYIQDRAIESRARFIVFPESVVPSWNESIELFWEPTLSRLRSSGKTVMIGAGIDIPETEKYGNAVIIRGAETGVFFQRVPIPIGMWHPLHNDGVPVAVFGPSVKQVGGERIALLICYEQFLTWPVLTSIASRPKLLIGVSNHYWSHNTAIPDVQLRLLKVWSRLFGIPTLSAINL
jgi:apolipoprotein N-acyltransferase